MSVMLVSAASGRVRYMSYLEEQILQRLKKGCKKRKGLLEEVDEIKKKRRRLEVDIESYFLWAAGISHGRSIILLFKKYFKIKTGRKTVINLHFTLRGYPSLCIKPL